MGETNSPRIRRWLVILLIILCGVGVLAAAGMWWYYDRSDLAAVKQHAEVLGRPTTWKSMASPRSEDHRIQTWNDLVRLQPSLVSYRNTKAFRANSKSFSIWDPIPQALLDHHATLPMEKIAELGRLLDELGDDPLVLHEELTYRTLLPEIGVQRDLIRIMQERLLIADQADCGRWGKRMLASCRSFNGNSLILHMVRVSCIEIALSGIARRLPDLKSGSPEIAEDILATTKDLHGDLLRSLDGEFLIILDALSKNIAIIGDGVASSDLFMPLVVRVGRSSALIAHLNELAELRSIDPLLAMTWAANKEAELQAAKSGRTTSDLILRMLFTPAWKAIILMGVKAELHARLLVAEIRGEPWPSDPFDPGKSSLRPIFQDNRIIAGYSVDHDGIDHGGTDKRDRVFPLYAKPPKSASPLLNPSADP